jgi:hypothetical protein
VTSLLITNFQFASCSERIVCIICPAMRQRKKSSINTVSILNNANGAYEYKIGISGTCLAYFQIQGAPPQNGY